MAPATIGQCFHDVCDRGDSKDPRRLIGSMEMKRNATAAFTLKVTARDLNRDQETFVYLRVPEAQLGDRNDFCRWTPSLGCPSSMTTG